MSEVILSENTQYKSNSINEDASKESAEKEYKRKGKRIRLRDSYPCEDFEEIETKAIVEKVLLGYVKRIIKSIRNYIFRKRINERIKKKKMKKMKRTDENIISKKRYISPLERTAAIYKVTYKPHK